MTELFVDFGREAGRIKPLHGFNNCARNTEYGEILPDFLALRPPIVRLHDTVYPYGGGHYVDVNNIFCDFSADPDDETAYDFTLTDLYIKPLADAGIGILYRLGCTIEHAPKKYNVYPPADFGKWADVCEHIVRLYNCGWANGFHFGIRFWEIWNEPDGLDPRIEPNGPPNWQGTAAQYYRLYSVAANRIKALHPDVSVGGYSSCYILGKNTDGKWTEGDASFFTDFLAYISAPETRAPLDFFSWHTYIGKQDVKKTAREAAFVGRTLDAYGFSKTLRFITEWNCCVCDVETPAYRREFYINMRNAKGASHMLASLCEMQKCGVHAAMFYDAQLWKEYGPLFDVPSLRPTKAYAAFRLFGELYRLGVCCESTSAGDLYTCAAKGDGEMLAVSNVGPDAQTVTLRIRGGSADRVSLRLTDETHDAEALTGVETAAANGETTCVFRLPGYAFAEITLQKGEKGSVPQLNSPYGERN